MAVAPSEDRIDRPGRPRAVAAEALQVGQHLAGHRVEFLALAQAAHRVQTVFAKDQLHVAVLVAPEQFACLGRDGHELGTGGPGKKQRIVIALEVGGGGVTQAGCLGTVVFADRRHQFLVGCLPRGLAIFGVDRLKMVQVAVEEDAVLVHHHSPAVDRGRCGVRPDHLLGLGVEGQQCSAEAPGGQ